jgi:flagellar FliJ protein
MAFRFALETLLRLRQGLERQQELRLQAANHRVAMLRQQIEDVRNEIGNIEARRSPQRESGISAAELQFDVLCRSVLAERQNTLQKQLAEAETYRRARSEDFKQARQQREVMDVLRRQRFEDYRQEEARQDQRRLDDLFLLRRAYLRRN